MTTRLTGFGEALVASATLVLGVAAAALAGPSDRLVGVAVGLGFVLGSASLLVVGAVRRGDARTTAQLADAGADDAGLREATDRPAAPVEAWSTVVRLGDEPPAVARASIELAGRAGPVIVAVSGLSDVSEPPDALAGLAVQTVVGVDPGDALRRAVDVVATPAVLITSARAVPDAEQCRAAVRDLTDRSAAWFVGRSGTIGAHGVDARTEVGARLREALRRSGTWTWEADAVLVATGLVRRSPPDLSRPLGSWLRARAAEGHLGLEGDRCLTRRAVPAAGAAHAVSTVARRRAVVADLMGAAREGHGFGRRVAACLVVRELDAVALAAVSAGWWSTLLTGRSPWGAVTVPLVAAAAVVVALRWAMVRRAVGVAIRPWSDLRSTVSGLPSSVLAIPAAIRRRPLARRAPTPTRPLLWAALVLSAVSGSGLVDQASGSEPSPASIAVALATLVVLWGFGIRALVDRSNGRQAVRVRVDVPVRLGADAGRLVDASVSGLAVRLDDRSGDQSGDRSGDRVALAGPALGDEVEVAVEVRPGEVWTAPARLVARRRQRGGTVVGLALVDVAEDVDRAPWLDLLLAAVVGDATLAAGPVTGPGPEWDAAPRRAWGDVTLLVAGVAVSLAVVATLGMVLAGYQPLVVRSGSMTPTLRVGDLTVVEPVRAAEARPGDIVTRPVTADWPERLTHRVRSVEVTGGELEITTQGDANPFGERWTVAPSAELGRTVWSVPAVGAPALLLRATWLRGSVALLVLGWLLGALLRPRRLSSRRASAAW